MKYVTRHWRGDLSLTLSALVNGLIGYVLAVCVVVTLGNIFPGKVVLLLGTVAFAAWFLWALVGISRCVWKILKNDSKGVVKKVVAVAIGAALIVVVAISIRDVIHLVG